MKKLLNYLPLHFLIGLILGIILLAIGASLEFTSAIRNLTTAVQMVDKNQLSYRLPASYSDEIGDIFKSFNVMIKGLQEKELMGSMVSQFARKASSDEKSAKEAEKGIKIQVAVLYIVVPHFQNLVKHLSSNDLITELSQQVNAICKLIISAGGDIDKVMGEKLLAVFYSPDEEGIESLLGGIKAMEVISRLESFGHLKFPVTMGLHFGEVLAGLLGVGNQRDFTVIGDAVNTAARIAGKASELPKGKMLVSQTVQEHLINKKIGFKPYGEVELKGKKEKLKLFSPEF